MGQWYIGPGGPGRGGEVNYPDDAFHIADRGPRTGQCYIRPKGPGNGSEVNYFDGAFHIDPFIEEVAFIITPRGPRSGQ